MSDLLTLENKDSLAEQTSSETSQSTPSTPNVPLKKRIIVNQMVTEGMTTNSRSTADHFLQPHEISMTDLVTTFPVQSQAVPNDLYARNNELGVVKQEIDSSTEFNPNFHSTLQYQPVIDTQREPVTVINGKRTFQHAFNGKTTIVQFDFIGFSINRFTFRHGTNK